MPILTPLMTKGIVEFLDTIEGEESVSKSSKFPFEQSPEEVAYFVCFEELRDSDDLDDDDEKYDFFKATFKTIKHKRVNSNIECVFEHVPTGRLFKFWASYDSWNGTDLYDDGDMHEVRPVEKTITVYEKI